VPAFSNVLSATLTVADAGNTVTGVALTLGAGEAELVFSWDAGSRKRSAAQARVAIPQINVTRAAHKKPRAAEDNAKSIRWSFIISCPKP
jgi:hypothetical protein